MPIAATIAIDLLDTTMLRLTIASFTIGAEARPDQPAPRFPRSPSSAAVERHAAREAEKVGVSWLDSFDHSYCIRPEACRALGGRVHPQTT
jgi:hypothetical protein